MVNKQRAPRKRRLILFLDGTWNEDGVVDEDTNVVRLRDALAYGIYSENADLLRNGTETEFSSRPYGDFDYYIFYERGVGTGPGLDRILGGALGLGLDTNVRRAYKFLSRHYRPGSEIFIFGFSRGAYTARSLAGYVGSAGLLLDKYCDAEMEDRAWSYYRTSPNDRLPAIGVALKQFTHPADELRISCLGVFDTVGALGIPIAGLYRLNRSKYEFHDVELSPVVQVNLHALAIDEHRPEFRASVWRVNKYVLTSGAVEQTWFCGAHSDIGGGYFSDDQRSSPGVRGLDDITFEWMKKRVKHYFDDFPIDKANPAQMKKEVNFGLMHDSRSWKYELSRPAFRAIGNLPPADDGLATIVSYDRDHDAVAESIHMSVLERLGRKVPIGREGRMMVYAPRNLIECLPSLYGRYVETPDGLLDRTSLSVTTWEGNIVGNGSDEIGAVAEAVQSACDRLSALGIVWRQS